MNWKLWGGVAFVALLVVVGYALAKSKGPAFLKTNLP